MASPASPPASAIPPGTWQLTTGCGGYPTSDKLPWGGTVYLTDGKSGQLCKGLDVNGCENDPENQFKLFVSASGTWTPCAQNGVCGAVSR